MSLKQLVGTSLEPISASPTTARRLLDGAARNIADAQVEAVSAETRFTSAYTAIRMLADLGLHAHGYRVLTSRPGHHITAIQALSRTFGVDEATVARLDHLRRQRNAIEYSGDVVPEAVVAECLERGMRLQAAALSWLRHNKPGLLKRES